MTDDAIDALLGTPLFEGVDDELLDGVRTEAAITAGAYVWEPGVAPREGFVRFVDFEDGDDVVVQGVLTTDLVVVLAGKVEAIQARSGRDVFRHREYGPGDWFGEVSAHSHHPALATYKALGPARVALLEQRLFTRLYNEDDGFRERIDDGYRDNLGLHLRASSLCRELDDQALADLQRAAELVTVDDGDVLAAAGDAADKVWLVRAGAIGCFADGPGGERALAFYKGNATFGEHCLTTGDGKWPANYRALMKTSLVALPKRAFERLAQPARAGLQRAANRLIGRDDVDAASGEGGGSRQLLDELFVMVERESVKGGRALVIDRTKCVRCNMCVESCVAVHDDGVPRLSKVGTPVITDEVLVTACYHCETPQCMLSCDYAAIRRDPQGRIRFEYDNCVGCAGCIDGCPYGVIRLVEPKPPPAPKPSFWETLPVVGKWFRAPEPTQPDLLAKTQTMVAPGPGMAPAPVAAGDDDAKPRTAGAGGKLSPVAGKTIKCDLCAGLPFEACVYNCPTTAILRKEPQSLFDRGPAARGR